MDPSRKERLIFLRAQLARDTGLRAELAIRLPVNLCPLRRWEIAVALLVRRHAYRACFPLVRSSFSLTETKVRLFRLRIRPVQLRRGRRVEEDYGVPFANPCSRPRLTI